MVKHNPGAVTTILANSPPGRTSFIFLWSVPFFSATVLIVNNSYTNINNSYNHSGFNINFIVKTIIPDAFIQFFIVFLQLHNNKPHFTQIPFHRTP